MCERQHDVLPSERIEQRKEQKKTVHTGGVRDGTVKISFDNEPVLVAGVELQGQKQD